MDDCPASLYLNLVYLPLDRQSTIVTFLIAQEFYEMKEVVVNEYSYVL